MPKDRLIFVVCHVLVLADGHASSCHVEVAQRASPTLIGRHFAWPMETRETKRAMPKPSVPARRRASDDTNPSTSASVAPTPSFLMTKPVRSVQSKREINEATMTDHPLRGAEAGAKRQVRSQSPRRDMKSSNFERLKELIGIRKAGYNIPSPIFSSETESNTVSNSVARKTRIEQAENVDIQVASEDTELLHLWPYSSRPEISRTDLTADGDLDDRHDHRSVKSVVWKPPGRLACEKDEHFALKIILRKKNDQNARKVLNEKDIMLILAPSSWHTKLVNT